MNAAMPAWATSPTHDRSSAESTRYQSCADSIRRVAADDSSPADRSTRCRVAAEVVTRVGGIRGVYLYAADNPPRVAGQSSAPLHPRVTARSPPVARRFLASRA